MTETEWLQSSAIGTLRSMDSFPGFQEQFALEGFTFSVVSFGNNQILISGRTKAEIENFLNVEKAWLDRWFYELHLWTPRPRSEGRLAWLRVVGMPLHCWCGRGFREIGQNYGEVVAIDEYTKSKSHLSVGRLLVYSFSTTPINDQLSLRIDGRLFKLTVIEDPWRDDPIWWILEGMMLNSDSGSEEETDYDDGLQSKFNDDVSNDGSDDVSNDGSDNSEQHMLENLQNLVHGPVEVMGMKENQTNNDMNQELVPVETSKAVSVSETEASVQLLHPTHGMDLVPQSATNFSCHTINVKHVLDCYSAGIAEQVRIQEGKEEDELAELKRLYARAANVSLTDGGIENRNIIVHRELGAFEVRKLFALGPKFGISMLGNEEEICIDWKNLKTEIGLD